MSSFVPVRQTSAMAIASLVLGVLGWSLLPFIGAIGAVLCGHMARADIRRAAGTLEGDGLAVVGLLLGYAAIVLGVATLLAIFLFFGGLLWFATVFGS